MRKELDEALCRNFPNLYSRRHGDPRDTCMCFGFECGDGWYDLIREASRKIEELILELPEADREGVFAEQVKEKFAGLRLYMSGMPTQIYSRVQEVIREAEKKSFETCERCGKPGELYTGGWLHTLCPEHAEGRTKYESRD